MVRISTLTPNQDLQYYMRLRQEQMANMQNQIGSQNRLQELRDDPLAAARAVRLSSDSFRLDRFNQNVAVMRGRLAVTEGYLSQAVSVTQRIRELAVQGANGTLDANQRRYVAVEVNQLLDELVSVAGARGEDGRALFGGYSSAGDPFRVVRGRLPDGSGDGVMEVQYVGDIGRPRGATSATADAPFAVPGNYAFWAENQEIYANVDATNYQVLEPARIRVDGIEIALEAGDNVFSLMDKINNSSAPVRARLDPVRDSLVLESSFPHQIWLEDREGTTLSDLGMVKNPRPPQNAADSARVFGGSLFDMVISLRDALLNDDTGTVGSAALGGIDQGLESLISNLTTIGAVDSRLATTGERISQEQGEVRRILSENTDLDLAKAITDLRALEYTHEAAYAAAARVLQPRLMDFLR